MIIVYNLRGVMLTVFGIGCFGGVKALTGSAPVSLATGLVAAAAGDLILRFTGEPSGSRAIGPDAGGHIWFVPIWTWSCVLGLVMVYLAYA